MILSLLFLVKTFLFFLFVGFGAHGFLTRKYFYRPTGISIAFGYALSSILFYFTYNYIGINSYQSIYLILGISFVINIAYLWRYKINKTNLYRQFTLHKYVYVLFFIVTSFSSISYIVTTPMAYWHSANEDTFDGLNGRNAYLSGKITGYWSCDENCEIVKNPLKSEFRLRSKYIEETRKNLKVADIYDDESIYNVGDSTAGPAYRYHEKGGKIARHVFFANIYSKEPGALQYSNLALMSVIINEKRGTHAFVVQSLLTLGLFALGIYSIVKHIFRRNFIISSGVALFSVLGNFYLNTYLNGHIGSMMYNAVALFAIGYFLKWIVSFRPPIQSLLFPIVFGIFIFMAYPYPAVYIIPILCLFAFTSWYAKINNENNILFLIKDWRYILFGIISLLIIYYFAYDFGEWYRIRNETKFRAWGTSFTYVGFLQFWGIWLSDLANTRSPLMWLEQQDGLKHFSFALGCVLSTIAVYGSYRLATSVKGLAILLFPALIFFFLIMRFAIVDSYYMYKFLYTYQWLIFIIVGVGFSYLFKINFYSKALSLIIFVMWISLNLMNNYTSYMQILKQTYNKEAHVYFQILNAPSEILRETFIDIPQYDHMDVVKQIFNERDVLYEFDKRKAKYLLKMDGARDIFLEPPTDIIWRSEPFSIVKMPKNDFVQVGGIFPPEGGPGVTVSFYTDQNIIKKTLLRLTGYVYESGPIQRWISDGGWAPFEFDVYKRTKNSDYLKFCAYSGPGIKRKPFKLHLLDASGERIKTFTIVGEKCYSAFIKNHSSPFALMHYEKAGYFSSVDRRRLVYGLTHLEFSDNSSLVELSYVAPDQLDTLKLDIVDIKNKNRESQTRLSLGNNWGLYERWKEQDFRWGFEGAEIIVSNPSDGNTLVFNVGSGPSAQDVLYKDAEIELYLKDENEKLIGTCSVYKYSECVFELNHTDNMKKYMLYSNSPSLPLPGGDDRILNYRLFNISLKDWGMLHAYF